MPSLVGSEMCIRDRSKEAYQEYLKERNQVDDIVKKIIAEDQKMMEDGLRKKEASYQSMLEALDDKEKRKHHEKEREKMENQKYLEYIMQKDQRENEIKAQRAEIERVKDEIFLKLKEEQEKKMREKELLEELRTELYKEEFDEIERRKERDEFEKKERQKREMQEAEREAMRMKEERRREEERMEKEFRDTMLKKFAEDDRLEQLNAAKRRMKELEHKREVESLWQEKLALYRAEREKELLERQRVQEEEKKRENIIKEEKERLLREHMMNIDGFLPKGLIEKPEQLAGLTKTKGSWQNASTQGRRQTFEQLCLKQLQINIYIEIVRLLWCCSCYRC
eukprot:TRINITY_DN9585_c0_g1_i10.p2 TRINITY_DN9585_c0_g1~~TRINITY_DN9585_c0_g1_i10.p2  ORF type:complete len:338 (-),score=112.50 TRINITY_DN9585_c0_g1_i10:168-1181(-)